MLANETAQLWATNTYINVLSSFGKTWRCAETPLFAQRDIHGHINLLASSHKCTPSTWQYCKRTDSALASFVLFSLMGGHSSLLLQDNGYVLRKILYSAKHVCVHPSSHSRDNIDGELTIYSAVCMPVEKRARKREERHWDEGKRSRHLLAVGAPGSKHAAKEDMPNTIVHFQQSLSLRVLHSTYQEGSDVCIEWNP